MNQETNLTPNLWNKKNQLIKKLMIPQTNMNQETNVTPNLWNKKNN